MSLCDCLFNIDGVPFVHLLTRACNPVSFFLLLSGYGMYIVYQKGDRHRFTRIARQYIHHWVVLTIFLIIGVFAFNKSIGSFITIISNYTGFEATYNGELWFLFPYVLLAVTSPYLFHFTDRYSTKYVLIILCFIGFCTSFLISRYGDAFFYHNYWAYNPLLYFHLMFSFYLGAMSAKHRTFEAISVHKVAPYLKKYGVLLLILLIIIRLFFRTSAFHAFYVYAFIALFLNINRPEFLDKVLAFLGKHSMNMWMIHSWFCYYLFKDFIYGFRYPLLILIVLLTVSLISSMLVDMICKPITKRIS